MLPKHWRAEKGRRCLHKGGSALLQEPCNEVIATQLMERLLPKSAYVAYALTRECGSLESTCELFLHDDEEYIPAEYVRLEVPDNECSNSYVRFTQACYRLGVLGVEEFLSWMIVCDDLLANTDRHWRNFGIIRNVETLECRMAPIFDTGTSLWCNREDLLLKRDFTFVSSQFDEHPGRQLRHADLSWLNCDKLDGLPNFAHGVLTQSRLPEERIGLVCAGMEYRIERIKRICDVW